MMPQRMVSTLIGAAGRLLNWLLGLKLGKARTWGKAALLGVLVLTALWCFPRLVRLLVTARVECEGTSPLELSGLTWFLGGLELLAGLAILASAGWVLWRMSGADAEWWCDTLAMSSFAVGAFAFGVLFYRCEAGHATGPGWTRLIDLLLDVATTVTPLAWFSGIGLCCLLALLIRRSRWAAAVLVGTFALAVILPFVMDALRAERERRAHPGGSFYDMLLYRPSPVTVLHDGSAFGALAPLGVLAILLGKGVSRRRKRLSQGDLVWWAQRTACTSGAGGVFLLVTAFVVRDDLPGLACDTSSYAGHYLPMALSGMIFPSLCFLAVAALGFLITAALKAMALPTNTPDGASRCHP